MSAAESERVLVEGDVMYRDRQKWRQRWCCLKKTNLLASPRVQLMFYTAAPADPKKAPNENHTLDDFCGLDCGQGLDGEVETLSIVTAHITFTFGLRSRNELERWTRILKRELGSEWTFDVKILPTRKKIQPGEATLRFFPNCFSLTSGNPCMSLGFWMHNQLRRYGGSTGFSFEAGSKCYGGEGVYKLESKEGKKIKELFDCVANNKRLPEPPKTLQMVGRRPSSSSERPPLDSVAGPRSPARSASHSSALYTPPPNMPKSFSDTFQSSTRRSPSSVRSQASTPGTPGTPPGAGFSSRPPASLPRRASHSAVNAPTTPPDPTYMNLQSDYTYVKVGPRPLPSEDLKYIQVAPGSTPAEALAGGRRPSSAHRNTLPAAARVSTQYSDVDLHSTRSINTALSMHHSDRQRPLEQN